MEKKNRNLTISLSKGDCGWSIGYEYYKRKIGRVKTTGYPFRKNNHLQSPGTVPVTPAVFFPDMMIKAIGSNYFFEKANHPAFVTGADIVHVYSILKKQAIISLITIDKTIK